jgi:CYTH domain-containing protein
MIEIERKYLIGNMDLLGPLLLNGRTIEQGYLFVSPDKSCRIRLKGDRGFITLKFGESAFVRSEFEYEIPLVEAEALLRQCSKVLSKTRFEVVVDSHVWEIDVFHGKHQGLIVAEIELSREDESFVLPDWVGKEVTADKSYLNVNLIERL